MEIGVGLIGSGFMGRSHALAFRAVNGVFDLPVSPRLECLADVDAATAERAAKSFGFARSSGDWRTLLTDPAIDLIDITAPNVWHKPMALAAIGAGKAVYCEKPLAPSAGEAKEMADAAEAAGILTMVGFKLSQNRCAAGAQLIESGEIGEVVSFRGIHAEDYMTDKDAPFTWRLDASGGHGVVADLGSHIISIARFLVGDIAALCGQIKTVVGERPVAPGAKERRKVEVDDQARALLRFASGATGSIEASWVAAGRKMTLAFEVTGSKGTIAVDHERMNELQLYTTGQTPGRAGFKTILAGPEHAFFKSFCPAPGHQLGFNDVKTIGVRAARGGSPAGPSRSRVFAGLALIQRTIDAIVRSALRSGGWRQRKFPSWLNVHQTGVRLSDAQRLFVERFAPVQSHIGLRQVRRDHSPLRVGQVGLVSGDDAAMLLSSSWRSHSASKFGSRNSPGITEGALTQPF
jgi:predicted dehydrogenase